MKKSFFALASLMLVSMSNMQADNGGAVVGGLFGGLALGSIIGAAAASRPREVVVIEERHDNHDYSKQMSRLKNMERDLKNWQQDLEKYERELQKAERELEKRAERLTAREEKIDRLIERLEKE